MLISYLIIIAISAALVSMFTSMGLNMSHEFVVLLGPYCSLIHFTILCFKTWILFIIPVQFYLLYFS